MATIFIIHSKGHVDKEMKLAADLESQGHTVYVPLRDTDQNGTIDQICESNKKAMMGCDEVRVIWDGTSHGVIFDVGMAFALGKKIKTEYVNEKSIKDLIKGLGTK